MSVVRCVVCEKHGPTYGLAAGELHAVAGTVVRGPFCGECARGVREVRDKIDATLAQEHGLVLVARDRCRTCGKPESSIAVAMVEINSNNVATAKESLPYCHDHYRKVIDAVDLCLADMRRSHNAPLAPITINVAGLDCGSRIMGAT